MEEIIKISSIAQYNTMRGIKTKHPLATVIDLSKAQPMPARSFNFGFVCGGSERTEQWPIALWKKAL